MGVPRPMRLRERSWIPYHMLRLRVAAEFFGDVVDAEDDVIGEVLVRCSLCLVVHESELERLVKRRTNARHRRASRLRYAFVVFRS